MPLQKSNAKTRSTYIFLLVIGIVLVAFNLRPAITSVGPLIGMIQENVGLAHWSAGLLMSLPLLVFATMSPIVPKLANRLTNEMTLLLGLISLLIGIGIRSIPMTFFLFMGTLLVGAGIAIGNVLLPAVVKDKFPHKFGLMTSVYSTSMGLIASLASGISVPLADGLNLGWQGALIVWGIPVVAAIFVWAFLLKMNQGSQKGIKRVSSASTIIWRSPLAWQIAIFMGFQSFLFYVTISWLPEILHSRGMSMGTAGWMLSFTQLVGLPASFFIPVIAGRFRSQVWIALLLSLCSIFGYGGLLLGSSYPVLIASITLIGIGLGGLFPLALSYIGLRARNANQAVELSGMAQSTGYILAAIGPLFIGYLYDKTHIWTVPLTTLIVISLIVMVFGMLSGRNRFV
ncbi:ABC transporter permease [Neobacillus bataviensis LMG 21833]|uniref:ABC transporter permease n=1 Tax=Neobacillus bataviensis LMG 21833 TaxID=1117379 RepID=K6DGC2_9BACI|nr:MFS transporter [Neobacillus bataviensis]EKN71617.1 ABC transporter permease [Neobacillus bataviensis LMG 21833]